MLMYITLNLIIPDVDSRSIVRLIKCMQDCKLAPLCRQLTYSHTQQISEISENHPAIPSPGTIQRYAYKRSQNNVRLLYYTM